MELWWYHSYLPLYLNNHLGSKCMMGLTTFISLKLIWFPLSVTTIPHDSIQKLFLIFHFMWYLLHQVFQCISSYGFENNTSLLITSLSSQSTNDLGSSLWFKNVDTDYWSLNNENNQERMATKMPLIQICGMAILNLRNSRQYTWAFLSLTHSVVKFNG